MIPTLVLVPAGSFLMGTSEAQIEWLSQRDETAKQWWEKGRFRREQPQHVVNLAAYQMCKSPISVAEYYPFVTEGGYQHRQFWTQSGWAWREMTGQTEPAFWGDEGWTGDGRFPVIGVSWYEAVAFSRWLSEVTGYTYRLPTEAEWEKAARGEDGRLYPWGNEFHARKANTRASGRTQITPIGQYSVHDVSPYGCVEMAGNVSEWTLSQFKPYPYAIEDGRNEPEGTVERVIRGGSWFKPILRARTAARGMNDPFFADNDVGFRLVRIA